MMLWGKRQTCKGMVLQTGQVKAVSGSDQHFLSLCEHILLDLAHLAASLLIFLGPLYLYHVQL